MGTGINHLVRRAGCYWWRRRIPRVVAVGLEDTIARSLRTADPLLARRRARRCSAAFDAAMMRLMTMDRPPTRSELKAVLDAVFRGVLDDGEDRRAARPRGEAPDWIPCPQDDPQYDGLEPEQWHSVPTEPQLLARQWRDAELLNDAGVVEPLVRRALDEAGVPQPPDGIPWRRYLRLALRAAADAHEIDARREHGDFSGGYPATCRVPDGAIPPFGPEPEEPAADRPPAAPGAAAVMPAPATIAFIASYADWMASKVSWSPKTRRQGEAVLSRFCALMDERAVEIITQAVAERFRDRLRRVPRLNGKGIYAGLTLREAVVAADAIEAGLKTKDGPVLHDGKLIPRDRAAKLVVRISLKTINRDLTFLVDWGGWMAHSDERRELLARARNPFAGLLIEKRTVARDSAASGRKRRPFTGEEVGRLITNLPAPGAADDDHERPGARRWAVLIAMYSGMRLGEIVQLRVADIRREMGVDFFDLSEEEGRKLKTEAGARRVPIHPALVDAGILELVSARRAVGAVDLLPRAATDVGHQRPVNALSKWFGRFRRRLGITSPAKTFHSTRHTFADALRSSADGRDALCDQILGHEPGGVGARVYTRPLPLARKYELVASVNYRDPADVPSSTKVA